MAKNKITTSQGNVQFTNAKGRTINMHPMHCYAVYEGDTVSFLFIYMKEYSGQAFFASQYEDLEVDGVTYDSLDALKEAIAEAFAKAGAQARTEIVDELPETGYTNTIYLVKKEHGEGYDEYIYNEEKGWQLIGDTDIEFERYLQKVDFNAYSADTKEKIDFISGAVDDNASDIQFISGAVDTEISNREAADTAISGAVDTLSSDLASEVSRAQNAEQTLQNNINTANARIDAEQIARANADNALSGAVDSVVSDLASEVSRATAKENEIDSKVDGEISNREAADTAISGAVDTLSANLSLEVQRAQNAESALNSKVNALSGEVETMGDEAIVDAAYVSTSTTIDFYNADGAVVAQVDATDFIKDGMIEDVRIENGYLIIDFNTESGIQDIEIPLTDIFNPDNYYDKTAVDGLLADKADLSALTEDERVWGEALNDLNLRVNTFSASVETELSSKANSADVYTKSEVYTKAEVDEAIAEIDLSDYYTRIETDGKLADKADLSALTEDERVLGEALNDLNSRVDTISGDVASKFDASGITAYSTSQEVTAEIEAATSGKAENSDLVALSGEVATLSGNAITSGDVQNQIDAAVSGKQDTLIAGENITIVDNVISAEGGGKAIEAGRGISITTGETADTVSFNLPISADTKDIILWDTMGRNSSKINYNFVGGKNIRIDAASSSVPFIDGGYNAIYGENIYLFAPSNGKQVEYNAIFGTSHGVSSRITCRASLISGWGNETQGISQLGLLMSGSCNQTKNNYESVVGQYNNSVSASTTFGDSGNTLFSVGNGTNDNARHNAFEIRQNGDIYCSDGTNDVKLQDTITATSANTTALGGLSLVKLTQAEYDALVTKDSNTLYIISD